ncbi:MAG: single-stranded-DNA-specific exonuclease RecJ [Myxococcales bacterium]|nr:single-stranded-DNA-specific exonuclease RecJ [Myxococcales bacterium]
MSAAFSDPGPASAAALALAQTLGLSITVAAWLEQHPARDAVDLERWLEPKLAQLTPPDRLADLGATVERLSFAVRRGERVAVFGDYDCDGITSCAIMTEVLRAFGAEVVPLLASRFDGGYGFSARALDKVIRSEARLLVTCDCGSSDHARLALLRERGIDAIVIDHHLVPAEPLPVLAFLNPHRPDCGFPYKGLASCGLALLVANGLRRALEKTFDVRTLLDLVAIGTVADVAPLTGDNRAFVKKGLEVIGTGQRIGLDALALRGTGGRRRAYQSEDVAFQLAPRLNAPGRLGDPMPALQVLLERDPVRAHELANQIEELTLRRRALQRVLVEEALADVETGGFSEHEGLVLARQGWHVGIVGIVAGRLASTLQRPVIVVALEGETGRGSARAPAGFRIHDALSECRPTLAGFGGHQAAAGLELHADRLPEFREAWRAACAAQLAMANDTATERHAHVRLDPKDELRQVIGDLERLEPCGHGNPAPRIYLPAVEVLGARSLKGHLKLDLSLGGKRIGGFFPEHGDKCAQFSGRRVTLSARLKRDHYRGGDAIELLVHDYAFE